MKLGRLRNGNEAAPITATWEAPRCEAKAKHSGKRCRCRATKYSLAWFGKGLCYKHGGAKGSGKITPEGRKRIAEANYRHGRYTAEGQARLKEERQKARRQQRELDRAFGIKRRSGGPDVSRRARASNGRFL